MTAVADRRPRLIKSLLAAQSWALALWRQSSTWPHRDARNPYLRALSLCDGVLSRAHVVLPSGILTMEYMEPAVTRDARRVLARVRRLKKKGAL